MLKIFNSFALTSKQRFTRALIVGIPTALGLGIGYGLLTRFLPITFSIVYVGIGYLIGLVIQRNGRGVQPKFSFLAAGLAIVSFILADLVQVAGLNFLAALPLVPLIVVSYLNSLNGLINLAFIAFGVLTAYRSARIV